MGFSLATCLLVLFPAGLLTISSAVMCELASSAYSRTSSVSLLSGATVVALELYGVHVERHRRFLCSAAGYKMVPNAGWYSIA